MTELAVNVGGRRHAFVLARIWWRAIRPFSFPLSLMPALLGMAFAWTRGVQMHAGFALLTALGAVAAHAGANLMQDYFDYTSGIDKPGKLGGSGILVSGILGPNAVFLGSMAAFAAAAIVALPLVAHAGGALIRIALAGFVLAVGYAFPRYGFKYYALGDAAVFVAFGIGITLGSYLIQAGAFSLAPLACGAPFGLLVVAVLLANNMRDADDDAKAGVRTLAVLMGERSARILYIATLLAAFAMPVLFVHLSYLNAGALLSVLALPAAFSSTRKLWRAPVPARADIARFDEATAKVALLYGALMAAGMVAWRCFMGGV